MITRIYACRMIRDALAAADAGQNEAFAGALIKLCIDHPEWAAAILADLVGEVVRAWREADVNPRERAQQRVIEEASLVN